MRRLTLLLVATILLISSVGWTQTHFTCVSNTGNNGTVAVPNAANPNIDGAALATGDEIAVFTQQGLCAGVTVWTAGENAAITVWGDNDQTPDSVDGLQAGEQMLYRVWRQATDTEHADSSVTYSQGDGLYAANGIYVLSSLAFSSDVVVGVEERGSAALPNDFALAQNYPNPFNPNTTISFTLPQAGEVTLAIYNLRGQLVRALVSGPVAAGRHQVVWDGADFRGVKVASGIYVYRLQAKDPSAGQVFVATKKLALTK